MAIFLLVASSVEVERSSCKLLPFLNPFFDALSIPPPPPDSIVNIRFRRHPPLRVAIGIRRFLATPFVPLEKPIFGVC